MAEAPVPAPEVPTPSAAQVSSSPGASVTSKLAAMKNYFVNSGVALFLIVGIAVAFLTAYILYYVINKTISNQQSYLIPETKTPILTTQESTFSADAVPNSGNGKRASLSFWMYIYDIQKFTGVMRHILHRGGEGDGAGVAGPYISLDPNTNKVYVTFAPTNPNDLYNNTNTPNGVDNSATFTSTTNNPTASEQFAYLNAVRGISIDYIPLQRWVHIAIVVNEDAVIGGSISAYVDGAFVKTVTSSTAISGLTAAGTKLSTQPTFSINDVNLDKKGNIYTGGAIGSAVGPGFSGMVSMIKFYNYDMNANDVYSEYQKGPIDNVLAKVGLPAYGIQSPIYRIG
jgi:hypothetical protein